MSTAIANTATPNAHTDFNHPLPLHIATLIEVRAGKAMPFARRPKNR
ncbi:hypothetical protein R0I52_02335 [Psychrobacter sp. CAM01]|nr:hypothetical protein [Psychrobacter sp. CAM01]MDV2859545.1 hypothetical protein [Psychrobacter sp. CAM01]